VDGGGRAVAQQYLWSAYLVKFDGNVDILGVFHGALDITKYQL
jgi:hypothetical protein